MSMKIVPPAAVLGAEIAGVDLSRRLDIPTFAAIERAYNEYGVIFFRGQTITPAQHVAFTRRFGDIEFNIFGERWSVPGHPEIVVLSNITDGGQPTGVRRRALAQRHVLHGEAAARDRPARARGPRAARALARGHRVRERRRLGGPARRDEARPRWPAGRLRFPWTQAGLDADSGGDRPQSPGSPSDRADSPVDRSQVPLRDARRLHRHRGNGARRGGGVDR